MDLSRIFGKPRSTDQGQDTGEHWLSVSDLMAGLMMVFLFISIALMRNALQDSFRAIEEAKDAQEIALKFEEERNKANYLSEINKREKEKVKQVALTYQENQVAIYKALYEKFKDDLPRWDAEIDQHALSFNFKSPDVLFDTGKVTIKPAFQQILNDFFPRYIDVLMQFRDSIDEVRIEGHTSSDWGVNASPDEAYFNNMELSQGRTRAVLSYVYTLPASREHSEWIKRHLAAVGFSSARLIKTNNGTEDRERSRRVLFRVVTNAETQIRRILDLTDAQ